MKEVPEALVITVEAGTTAGAETETGGFTEIPLLTLPADLGIPPTLLLLGYFSP